MNVLVRAEFTREGLICGHLLGRSGFDTGKTAKAQQQQQQADMFEKLVKVYRQNSCLHLYVCVPTHTQQGSDSASFDFKIKGQIHYRIIKWALEKRIGIL